MSQAFTLSRLQFMVGEPQHCALRLDEPTHAWAERQAEGLLDESTGGACSECGHAAA